MLHKMREYAEQILGNEEKEREFYKLACGALEMIKATSPEAYCALLYKMHCLVHGCHFDRELAEEAVKEMRNVDGSVGAHWTYEEVENAARQHGIDEVADFYYAVNMLFSDLANLYGSDASTYIKIAKALYFDDPDMPKGKLFRQWYAVHCCEE